MKHQPERTCIGCRGVFKKDEVVRIVAGPDGPVLDYREKLPGRAAYVCPKKQCLEKALTRESLSRAFKMKMTPPASGQVIAQLQGNIYERIRSLIAMAAKAGKLAAGFSAVQDALDKGRVELLLYAEDVSEGTREKIAHQAPSSVRHATVLTRDEFGKILSRELVGVVAFEEKGLADAVFKEAERLKSLIKNNE